MANIQNELNNIKTALYGKDVRNSIHDAIKTCYDDASVNNDNANMEVKLARGTHNTLNDRLCEVDEKQNSLSSQLADITTFKTFPSDDVLNNIPINTTFEVKGFYDEGDMPKMLYKKSECGANSINKGSYYIQPITEGNRTIYLPSLGIKQGIENSSKNSEILSNVSIEFGSLLYLPAGKYYFDRPIDLKSKQCSLLGEAMSFTPDKNTGGLTWLYFPNLKEGESAIIMGTGSLSNIIIKGSDTTYSYKIDRTKTYVDKDNIEKEVFSAKCYGVSGGSITSINNVQVSNFYYGCKLDTGNIYITNFYARGCHIGLSIGNDTKCKGIYGWNIHTLLEIRGSISSAIQVRADSCHHLVNLLGYMNGVYLSDLDADYCLGSVVKFGKKGEWCGISNITINGVVGRHACYNAYNKSSDETPTSASILSDEDVSKWAFISSESNCNLDGVIIITATNANANPLDYNSELRTPPILFASGTGNSIVNFHTTFLNGYGTDGNIEINRELLLDRFTTFSNNANSTRLRLDMPSGTYYIRKANPSNIYVTKTVVETLN